MWEAKDLTDDDLLSPVAALHVNPQTLQQVSGLQEAKVETFLHLLSISNTLVQLIKDTAIGNKSHNILAWK